MIKGRVSNSLQPQHRTRNVERWDSKPGIEWERPACISYWRQNKNSNGHWTGRSQPLYYFRMKLRGRELGIEADHHTRSGEIRSWASAVEIIYLTRQIWYNRPSFLSPALPTKLPPQPANALGCSRNSPTFPQDHQGKLVWQVRRHCRNGEEKSHLNFL